MLKRIGPVVLVLACAGMLNGCVYLTRASETQQGVSPPGVSQNPDLSSDGRYVAFDSAAALDPADPDDSVTDVLVRDNQTATVVRVSTGDGDAGNGPSRNPSISDNGRFVAFESDASNLVPLDTNSATDVFWHDRDADADGIYDEPGAVAMVAASAVGFTFGNGASTNPSITGDGTTIVFQSFASNFGLSPADTNGVSDIYAANFDVETGQSTSMGFISVRGEPGLAELANGPSWDPVIRDDKHAVAFTTAATNLFEAGDPNNHEDIVVRTDDNILEIPLNFPVTGPISPRPNASQASPQFIGNSTKVVYSSSATNLAPGDTGVYSDVFVSEWSLAIPVGITHCLSRTPAGAESNGSSFNARPSGDGSRVAFESSASDLVPGDTNAVTDVFVRAPGFTQLASTNALLGVANSTSSAPSISGDGAYVAFASSADNLETPDTNPDDDIFVRAAVVPEIDAVVAIDPNTQAEIPAVLHPGNNTLLVRGRGFGPAVTGLLGTGVTVTFFSVLPDRLVLSAVVAAGTPPGPRTLAIANLGTGLGVNAGALRSCTSCVQIAP